MTAGVVAGGRGGGGAGAGRPITADDAAAEADRRRQGEEAARTAPTITRPMPPREYQVDLWLLRDSSDSAAPAGLAQKLSKIIGGTGWRFEFPPDTRSGASGQSGVIEVSALVIPVDGERLVAAITRQSTSADGTPASNGWLKAVDMPKADAVLSFEIPGYSLRLQIARR